MLWAGSPREELLLCNQDYAPEWPAVKGGREGHDGVGHWQEAEEEHQQQEAHVEVVGTGGFEHTFMGDVAAHHRPALEVHGGQQAQHIDAHQSWSIERAHPGSAETTFLVSWTQGRSGRDDRRKWDRWVWGMRPSCFLCRSHGKGSPF